MNISPDFDAEAQMTLCCSTHKHAMRLFPPVWTQNVVCTSSNMVAMWLVWIPPLRRSGGYTSLSSQSPPCRPCYTINYYVPFAHKRVFMLQLRVAQCCVLRYKGTSCKNWTAHAPITMQRSIIFFLFFVQRWRHTEKALYISSVRIKTCKCAEVT